MIALLQESLHKKPHIEKLANQLFSYFSATILALRFAGHLQGGRIKADRLKKF